MKALRASFVLMMLSSPAYAASTCGANSIWVGQVWPQGSSPSGQIFKAELRDGGHWSGGIFSNGKVEIAVCKPNMFYMIVSDPVFTCNFNSFTMGPPHVKGQVVCSGQNYEFEGDIGQETR